MADASCANSPFRRTRALSLTAALLITLALAAVCSPVALAASHERPFGEVKATCSSVTFVFKNFPNAPNNVVTEKVYVHGELVYQGTFSFNGTTGSNSIPVTVPAGLGQVDGRASWNTNGLQGGYDVSTALNCSDPAFTIEKEQEIEGSGEGFTKLPLVAAVGKTVDYKIIVKNTGNTSLTFSKFIDAHCQNVTGGPAGSVLPGETTIYFCNHTLTEADLNHAPTYENEAKLTGTPPKGEGTTTTHTSNVVIVKFPKPNERPNGEVNSTCTAITFTYRKFPNAPNNTVTEKVYIKGVLVVTKIFHFNGPSGSDTIPITVPPGLNQVDGRAKWNTNGFSGGWDVSIAVKCSATPSYNIEKLQEIEGGGGFTTGPVAGKVGQTVDYEVIVTNTGNTSLTFSNFTDANCGSIAGGPVGPLASGESATYTCSHLLGPADGGHAYDNNATVTGTPPPEQGSPITQTSNTVVVNVAFNPEPGFSIEKLQHIAGSGGGFTNATLKSKPEETIEYEIVVKNTGNVPLTLSSFTDAKCNEGTIGGGPGGSELAVGESTTYTCSHFITEADLTAGFYENVASVTGTPPPEEGAASTEESNTVVVKVDTQG